MVLRCSSNCGPSTIYNSCDIGNDQRLSKKDQRLSKWYQRHEIREELVVNEATSIIDSIPNNSSITSVILYVNIRGVITFNNLHKIQLLSYIAKDKICYLMYMTESHLYPFIRMSTI